MALRVVDLFAIADLVRNGIQPSHILSLGYPDVLAAYDELTSIFDGKLLSNDDNRSQRNGFPTNGSSQYASRFFGLLNAKLTCFDKRKLSNVDENVDLNYRIDIQHHDLYTLVIDPGTIEHVMNVGEALMNIVHVLRIGGYVYHVSPMSMLNHGYWNFSPVTYHDFYTANGFEIVKIEGRRKKGMSFDVPIKARFKENVNLMIVCVAKKLRHVEKIVWPMQEKYM